MVTSELLDFIRLQLQEGVSKEKLEPILIAEGGWNKDDVAEAFASLTPQAPPPLPVIPPAPAIPMVAKEIPPVVTSSPQAVTIPPPASIRVASPIVLEKKEIILPAVEIAPKEMPPLVSDIPKELKVTSAPKPSLSTVPPEDDFLGLFQESQTEVKKEAPIAPVTPSVVSFTPPPVVVPKEVLPPVLPPKAIEQNPVLPSLEDLLSSTSKTVPSMVESPQIQAEIPPPQAEAFKFDFSKIRAQSPAETPVEITKAGDVQPPPVTIPGANKEIHFEPTPPGVPQSLPPVLPLGMERIPDASVSIPAGTPVSTMEESLSSDSGLSGKRTMASDLLLRGTKSALPGVPAMNAPVAPVQSTFPQAPTRENKTAERSANPPLAEEIKKKNQIKRFVALTIAAVALVAFAGIGLFAYFKLRGPDSGALTATAFEQFFATSAFSYKANGDMNLVLSTATNGVARSGIVKFTIDDEGSLENSGNGFGDGLHHVKLSGELRSGTFQWLTNIETDIRIIGSALYFHVLSFPVTSNLDADLFKTYWIRIDLSEIAKELALSGLSVNQEEYGNFGGQNVDTTFNALLKKNSPWAESSALPDEELGGVSVYHMSMKADPEKMLSFALALHKKYLGKELILTDDQRLRLRDALGKIEGEAWINKDTGMLVKVALAANFDDDFVNVRVKGPVHLSFTLADWNTPVVVDAPAPILTLEELRVRMDDFAKVKELRVHDREKVDRLSYIVDALTRYNAAKGRYPNTLPELSTMGFLSTTTVDATDLKTYIYAPYISANLLTKANRCTTKGKVCAYYHIGVNLEDTANPLLEGDADLTSDVRGADTSGCGTEAKVACYDLSSEVKAQLAPVVPIATGTPAN